MGEHIAELTANSLGDLASVQNATEEDLVYRKAAKSQKEMGIKGIGKEIAKSIVSYFENDSNRNIIERLLAAGIEFEATSRTPAASVISEKAFVLTGTLDSMKRSEAKELILKKGGRLASSVSSKTDYLVVGESAGSKLEKAKDLGIAILEKEDFLRLLGEANE